MIACIIIINTVCVYKVLTGLVFLSNVKSVLVMYLKSEANGA